MSKVINILTNISLVGFLGLASYHGYDMTQELKKKNTIEAFNQLNHYDKIFYNKNHDGKSFYDLHSKLLNQGRLYLPKTIDEAQHFLYYSDWLGSLSCISDDLIDNNLMPASSLDAIFSEKINTLASNVFIMDNLLLNPNDHQSFIKQMDRFLKIQDKLGTDKLYYEETKKFMNDFSDAFVECNSLDKKINNSTKNDNVYNIKCPYVKRILTKEIQTPIDN